MKNHKNSSFMPYWVASNFEAFPESTNDLSTMVALMKKTGNNYLVAEYEHSAIGQCCTLYVQVGNRFVYYDFLPMEKDNGTHLYGISVTEQAVSLTDLVHQLYSYYPDVKISIPE